MSSCTMTSVASFVFPLVGTALETSISVVRQKLHNQRVHGVRGFRNFFYRKLCTMAAKRISQSSIDWAKLAQRVPEHQRANFLAFKSKSDGYLRRVASLPEKPPAIDWAFYKSKVPVAGMVDDFQKQYSALTIPYPPDTVSSKIDAQEKEIKADVEKFKKESAARIEGYKKQLAHLASLIPYDQMTMEDYRDAFPEDALDPINRPTFWPHTPEEQLDYVEKDASQPQSGH